MPFQVKSKSMSKPAARFEAPGVMLALSKAKVPVDVAPVSGPLVAVTVNS